LFVESDFSHWYVCCAAFTGNYVLNYLASRPKLLNYVTQALVQVLYAVAWMLFWSTYF